MPESVIMESLTLNDRTPYSRHYLPRDRRYRSPRLPTPDASRSSRETFESPYDNPSILARANLDDRSLGISHEHAHYRRDNRNAAAPHSPPYQNGEGQKPSLPPLKTVLGNNISSPPRTPSPGASPGQLAPREPSYITSTYKPPSLYPNKKQRTEMSHHGVSSAGPRFAPSVTLEPRTNGTSLRPNAPFPPMDSIDTRRANAQAAGSPPWSAQCPPQKSGSGRPAYENSLSHYQTPEQTPTSAMLEPALPRANPFTGTAPDPFTRQMRDSFGSSGDRPESRRSSISSYGIYPPRPYEREPSRPGQWPSSAHSSRDGYADPRESIRYSRPEEHQTRPIGYPPHPYQSSVPAFFMPSHYEYQHGKARKRSNLPKQSTEIMKTWFDQNIANPYPSEEQKAIFSNATGISMTQVSNWFINHRRRCPELRDKREKSRGGSDS
ncbi:Putative Homeobox domain-containing protein [Septoria linicola]|uniref:Homeobox domain-containing protein n=1 Tax=Septoria linicola TaxID=215465 RepID=A0A9Q9EJD7_9PEZI|nr:Putative Homeobox domain-containing protein [Septoria linicola]